MNEPSLYAQAEAGTLARTPTPRVVICLQLAIIVVLALLLMIVMYAPMYHDSYALP